MKIVFADYYSRGKSTYDIDLLIDIPGKDIFRHVDEFGVMQCMNNSKRLLLKRRKLSLLALENMKIEHVMSIYV